MKTNTKLTVLAMGISSFATLPLMAQRVQVEVQVPVPPPPAVTVQVPAPAPPMVQIGVPDSYVWDGYEYVGVVGDQFYYLGPNRVWLTLDPMRLDRWRHWEIRHADWRDHAIVNRHYRRDMQGHDHPWHHDQDRDRNRDHGHGH